MNDKDMRMMYGTKCNTKYLECGTSVYGQDNICEGDSFSIFVQTHFDDKRMQCMVFVFTISVINWPTVLLFFSDYASAPHSIKINGPFIAWNVPSALNGSVVLYRLKVSLSPTNYTVMRAWTTYHMLSKGDIPFNLQGASVVTVQVSSKYVRVCMYVCMYVCIHRRSRNFCSFPKPQK